MMSASIPRSKLSPVVQRLRRGGKMLHYIRCACALMLVGASLAAAQPDGRQYVARRLAEPDATYSTAWGLSGGTVVGSMTPRGATGPRAVAWNADGTWTDFTPPAYSNAAAYETTGGRHVGWGFQQDSQHALYWPETRGAPVVLHPLGWWGSMAMGIGGDQQVGEGIDTLGGGVHAMLWRGSAEDFIDLRPATYTDATCDATDGVHQVGYGRRPGLPDGSVFIALLWSGTPESYVELNPPGFLNCWAVDVDGDAQVGIGWLTDNLSQAHALLWHGTAESAIDLTPAGASAHARAVAGGFQAGSVSLDGIAEHAAIWSGSADSMIDLHPFLPPGYRQSFAFGVDAEGNVVGSAVEAAGGRSVAFQWIVVPEPAELATLLAGAALILRRKARRPAAG
jgi:hypothetical protein